MPDALVAGHICLDLIPELHGDLEFVPGRLIESGRVVLCTGGAVANTGIALTRLGVDARLLGKVADDAFGQIVRDLINRERGGLGASMIEALGESTSYTIVLNVRGHDRMFLHDPGCNARFSSRDVRDVELEGAKLIHFGYPTLMRRMYQNDGAELADLFARAKSRGVFTSLDMTVPDVRAESGRVDWRALIRNVAPFLDLFVPSFEELILMLDRRSAGEMPPAGDPIYERLASELMEMGIGIVGVKAGDQGLFVRVKAPILVPSGQTWAPGSYWAAPFEVEVQGATGAGDAAIAGLLMGALEGLSLEGALEAACAAGACCCERPDATSGILSFAALHTRIEAGWKRRPVILGKEWSPVREGIYRKVNP